jgi:hypothetical protein
MRLLPGAPFTDVEQGGRKGRAMDMVVERCCGLDVHKDTVVACVRTPGRGGNRDQKTRTFGTMSTGWCARASFRLKRSASSETSPAILLVRLAQSVLTRLYDLLRKLSRRADELLGHLERRIDDVLARAVVFPHVGKTPFTVSRNFRTDSSAVFPAL